MCTGCGRAANTRVQRTHQLPTTYYSTTPRDLCLLDMIQQGLGSFISSSSLLSKLLVQVYLTVACVYLHIGIMRFFAGHQQANVKRTHQLKAGSYYCSLSTSKYVIVLKKLPIITLRVSYIPVVAYLTRIRRVRLTLRPRPSLPNSTDQKHTYIVSKMQPQRVCGQRGSPTEEQPNTAGINDCIIPYDA